MAEAKNASFESIMRDLEAGNYAPVYYLMGDEPYYISMEFVVPEEADGMQSIAFNMAEIRDACDYTIKNVVWRLEDNSEWLINKTGVENFWVKEGADTAPHVYDPNAPHSLLMQETFNFNNYSGVYFDGTQTIDGQYGKVLFAQGEGSNIKRVKKVERV